jgi:hypothetical protein
MSDRSLTEVVTEARDTFRRFAWAVAGPSLKQQNRWRLWLEAQQMSAAIEGRMDPEDLYRAMISGSSMK